MSVWLHKIVLVKADKRLFGKVVSDEGNAVNVEFFRSVADRESRVLQKSEIHHAALPLQTRVFLETSPGIWRVGRVTDKHKEDNGEFTYTIKFPNDEAVELHEDSCFVRCLDAYADPARILAAGCIETQFFADKRRPALRRLRNLRSAAQGLTGVLSGSIELVPHQIATVRRVTTDRIQRYLLADEVGLGKTIEAGLIIRQLLIDNPSLKAVVSVPDALVRQWKFELVSKCLVTESSVLVIPHGAMDKLDAKWTPDLLVVDEAHRLIAPNNSDAESREYSVLRQLALRVPKLLLLSATPALGDEKRLHALLNLLDPASYPIDRLDSFRRRVANRQQIGRLLLTMQPGASTFVLRQQAQRALEMFPNDPVVSEDASALLAGIEDSSKRDAITASLKDHIANTYRIHQRLIRARRQDVGWTMRARAPEWPSMSHVRLAFGQTAHVDLVLEGLGAWRDAATRVGSVEENLVPVLADRWRTLVTGAWGGGTTLCDVLDGIHELFAGEGGQLEELRGIGRRWALEDDRYEIVANMVRDWQRDLGMDMQGRPKKIVCFATNSIAARRLLAQLELTIGKARVVSLIGLGAETAAAVARFSAAAPISVAVCDAATEEGVNLQFVHGIVHLDLPLEAARVEQRIGRLDRFGRRIDKVEHRVFLPSDSDSAPWRSWFDLLANAFRVFSQSISDVQFRLEEIEKVTWVQLLTLGASAVEGLTEHIVAKLADERRQLDEQHALDHLAQLQDAGQDLLEKIEAAEEDEEELAADIEPWIRQVLGLQLEVIGESSAQYLEFSWGRDALLPEIPWRGAIEPSLHARWTWRRRYATQCKGKAPHLLRPGAAIVEVLERVALWDDRGISHATLRLEPGWQGMWRGFRYVWLIEPNVERIGPVYARAEQSELVRRAEGLLPPMTVEQFVDESGSIVVDERLLQLIQRPYRQHTARDGRKDINLGNRPDLMDQIITRRDFVGLIEEITLMARTTLLDKEEVATALSNARLACQRDIKKAERSFNVRASVAQTHPDLVERPLQAELDDLVNLQRAIEQPRIRLDEVGFVVIAGARPQ